MTQVTNAQRNLIREGASFAARRLDLPNSAAAFGLPAGLPYQLLANAGTILLGTALSKFFSNKKIVSNVPKPEIGDIRTEWEPNPAVFYPYGRMLRSGGCVAYGLLKKNQDGTEISDRVDLVLLMAEGALPEWESDQVASVDDYPIRATSSLPAAIADELNEQPRAALWIDGNWITFIKTPYVRSRNPDASTTIVESPYGPHYEPIPFNSGFEGGLRVYWNNLADGTQGKNLKDWSKLKPKKWDNKDAWVSPWGDDHLLTGLTWVQMTLNLSKQGIRGFEQELVEQETGNIDTPSYANLFNTPGRAYLGIKDVPRNYVFEFPGYAGLPNADGTPATDTTPAVENSAQVFRSYCTRELGLPSDSLNAQEFIKAQARVEDTKGTAHFSRTVFDGMQDVIEETEEEITPFGFNSIIRGNDDPVRIFKMFETLWGQSIAYQEGQIYPVVGYPDTTPGADFRISENDLWDKPRVTNNPELNERYNQISSQIVYAIQSRVNGPFNLPLINNLNSLSDDGREITREIRASSLINNFYQAQQFALAEARLTSSRRTIVLPIHYTNARAIWKYGTPITVNVLSSGIEEAEFVITQLIYVPGSGLIAEAKEKALEYPWTVPDQVNFFNILDDEQPYSLRELEIGSIPVPTIESVVRIDESLDQKVRSLIRVEFNDPDHKLFRLRIEWDQLPDPDLASSRTALFDTVPPAIFEVEPLGTVFLRARFELDEDTFGEWTEVIEITENRDVPEAPVLTQIIRHVSNDIIGDRMSTFDVFIDMVETDNYDIELQWRPHTTSPTSSDVLPTRNFVSSAEVVRVVDGDTIIVSIGGENREVRLVGVDTPETVNPQKIAEYYGIEASEYVKGLLPAGTNVHLFPNTHPQRDISNTDDDGNELDFFSRILAYVYRAADELFINHDLVRKGYGRAYTKYAFDLDSQFLEAQRLAEIDGLRLWSHVTVLRQPISNLLFYTTTIPTEDDAFFRARYIRQDEVASDWSNELDSAYAASDLIPVPGSFDVDERDSEAFISWIVTEDFPTWASTEVEWGEGHDTGQDVLDSVILLRPVLKHRILSLTPDSPYWIRARIVDERGMFGPWVDEDITTRSLLNIFAFNQASFPLLIAGVPIDDDNNPFILPEVSSGGTAPYTYATTLPPAGLAFDPATRHLTGTPTLAGQVSIELVATDATDTSGSVLYTINIRELIFEFSDIVQPLLVQDKLIDEANDPFIMPAATGGVGDLTYAVLSPLPTGLSFQPADRHIVGTPTSAGQNLRIIYQVTDTSGNKEIREYYIDIEEPGASTLVFAPGDTQISVRTGGDIVNPPNPQLPEAIGNQAEITYTTQDLPIWLAFDTNRSLTKATSQDIPSLTYGLVSFLATHTDGREAQTTILIEVLPAELPRHSVRTGGDIVSQPAYLRTSQFPFDTNRSLTKATSQDIPSLTRTTVSFG